MFSTTATNTYSTASSGNYYKYGQAVRLKNIIKQIADRKCIKAGSFQKARYFNAKAHLDDMYISIAWREFEEESPRECFSCPSLFHAMGSRTVVITGTQRKLFPVFMAFDVVLKTWYSS